MAIPPKFNANFYSNVTDLQVMLGKIVELVQYVNSNSLKPYWVRPVGMERKTIILISLLGPILATLQSLQTLVKGPFIDLPQSSRFQLTNLIPFSSTCGHTSRASNFF